MRPFHSRSSFVALLVPLLQSVAGVASAAEPERPWKTLFERCQKLSNEGDYTGALAACERAHALNADPGILAYIAQIHTALLHPVQARDALSRYLDSNELDSAERQTAEAQVRYLESLISRLTVTTHLAHAEIRVDGQVVDASTLARGVPLAAGAHQVTFKTEAATFQRFVNLGGGESKHLDLPGSGTIALTCALPKTRFFIDDREVDAKQAAVGVTQSAGSHRVRFEAETATWPEQTVAVDPDERAVVVCAASERARATMNPRGYWVTGAGVALGVAAIATAAYNGSEYKRWADANDNLAENINELPFAESESRAQENDELMASIKTRRKVSIGLGVASALVAAGGVALLIADSKATERPTATSWLRRVAAGLSLNGASGSGEIAWRGAW